jgi:hypothetical protein
MKTNQSRFFCICAVSALFCGCARNNSDQSAVKPETNPKEPEVALAVSGRARGLLDARGGITKIHGWAFDPTHPNQALTVDLYEQDSLLGSVLANLPRPDLSKVTKDNCRHGFEYPFPVSLRDGKTHSISARIAGANIELGYSPQLLFYQEDRKNKGGAQAANKAKTHGKETGGKKIPPIELLLVSGEARGNLSASGDVATVFGWAWDPTQPNLSIPVDIYLHTSEGIKLLGTALADQPRPKLAEYTKDNGKHGFQFPFPAYLRDKKAHVISVKISVANIELDNSPCALTFAPLKEEPGSAAKAHTKP